MRKNKLIRAIVKHPGQNPVRFTIANTQKQIRSIVGGNLKVIKLGADLLAIVNNNPRNNEMRKTCKLCGLEIYGPIVFVGCDGNNITDLQCDYITFKRCFKSLWVN